MRWAPRDRRSEHETPWHLDGEPIQLDVARAARPAWIWLPPLSRFVCTEGSKPACLDRGADRDPWCPNDMVGPPGVEPGTNGL